MDEACRMLAGHPHASMSRNDRARGLRFFPVGNQLVSTIESKLSCGLDNAAEG
jgi:hypothetical protein